MKNLKFRGVKNIRDFGGMVSTEGKVMQPGIFIRSSALCSLTEADIHTLQQVYHLDRVIDLRSAQEYAERPDAVIPGADYYNIPILESKKKGISHEKELKELFGIPNMRELYRGLGESTYSAEKLREVFSVICAEDRDGACLWHCSEGKDRCGIVSAWFLHILGFDMESIMDDYLYTNRIAKWKALVHFAGVFLETGDIRQSIAIANLFKVSSKWLEAYFDAVCETYGSLEEFAEIQLGVSEDVRERLKAKCLRQKQ